MTTRHVPALITTLGRRRFLGGSIAGACASLIPGGAFAGGGDRLRVGLVGCGGRGTGAAIDAASAHPAVRITALADLFEDQLLDAAQRIARAAGRAFDCPADRRFHGEEGWRSLLDTELDAVILATSPEARPTQAAAAVAAGLHVFCEAPAAIDREGVAVVVAANDAAAAGGLMFGSGLAWRHDPGTREAVERIRCGDIGRPCGALVRSTVGLPWRRSPEPAWNLAECARRNWVWFPQRSGGHLVERHVHAIDKALWALGDESPMAVEPAAPDSTMARYLFADGRIVLASIERREGGRDRSDEIVTGRFGSCDLGGLTIAGMNPWTAATCPGGRHARAMQAFVRAILTGRHTDDGDTLCRATLAAVLGRTALECGRRIDWPETGACFAAIRPVQSSWM